MPPLLLCEAAPLRRRDIPFRNIRGNVAVCEESTRVMQNEFCIHWHAQDPSGQLPIGVKMRFPRTAWEDVVTESLEFQRRSGASRYGKVLKGVERDNKLLPW